MLCTCKYNENILEYAEIARIGPKSVIRDIKGLSNKNVTSILSWCVIFGIFIVLLQNVISHQCAVSNSTVGEI